MSVSSWRGWLGNIVMCRTSLPTSVFIEKRDLVPSEEAGLLVASQVQVKRTICYPGPPVTGLRLPTLAGVVRPPVMSKK